MPQKIIPSQKLMTQIIEDYKIQTCSITDLSKKYKICHTVMTKLLKEAGITIKSRSMSIRKYSLNENFFDDVIDWGKEQYYLLGWILSDGSIKKNNEIKISIQERDKHVLELFKTFLNFSGPINFVDMKQYKEKNQNQVSITFANKHLADTLRLLGFDNKKTYNLQFPEWIPDKFLSYFIRGYFEGDGSICLTHKDYIYSCSIAGRKEFCISLLERIYKTIGLKGDLVIRPKYPNLAYARFACNLKSLKFLNYIYNTNEYILPRKFIKYKELIKITNIHNRNNETKLEVQKARENMVKMGEFLD